jgi:hypothetical protein
MNIQKFTKLKTIIVAFIFTIIASQTFAQTTNGIFFQAVVRDNYANPAKDRKIFVQSSIIQSTPTGTKVLTEEYQANTDAAGVFSISLGNGIRVGGTASGLSTIDWSKGPFFLNLKVAITPISGNSNWDYTKEWVDMGTTSFGAVPFALYSASSAKVDDKLNVSDTTKMLAVYAKAIKVQSLETAVASKLTAADTLTMLAPYAKSAITIDTSFFKAQLATKLSIADSTKYITKSQLASYNFSSGGGGVTVDTSSLSNRINLKANSTEIISLNNALTNKLNVADSNTKYITPAQLAAKTFDSTAIYTQLGTKLNKADTSTLSNRINLKANSIDLNSGLELKIDKSQKGVASGIASLDLNAKVPASQIPVISFQSANVVASQSAMLGLSSAVVGSIAIRTDINRNYVLSGANPSVIGNWVELAVPTSVTTINNIPGAYVTLTTDEIGEGTTNKYYTDTKSRSAISASGPLNYNAATGIFTMTAATTSSNGYLSASDFATFNNKQNTLVAGTDYAIPSGNITGNAANVTGIVSIANGGTGTSTVTGALANLGAEARTNKSTATDLGNTNPSDLLYPSQKAVKTYVDQQSANAGVADLSITNAKLANSTTILGSTIMTLGGTVTSVSGLSAVTATNFVGTLSGTATIATNIAGGVSGSIPYQTVAGTTSMIPTGSANQFLTSTGSGTYTWTTAVQSDASSSAKGIVQLAGDLGGTSTAPTVNSVGGVSSSTIGTINTTVTAATSSNTVNTFVKRDASGNFSAGTITANLTGNVIGSLTGNATTATTASSISGTIAIANGGTNATTAATALTNLGAASISANLNDQTGTTYTLQSSDNGKVVTLSNDFAITLTVPTGLSAGFNCMIVQKGAGGNNAESS